MKNLTNAELERTAYLAGDYKLAELAGIADDVDNLDDDLADAAEAAEILREFGSFDEIRESLAKLAKYREFFHTCFLQLCKRYPGPSIDNEHDKSMIYDLIRKADKLPD